MVNFTRIKQDIKELWSVYHVVNIICATVFIASKMIPAFCTLLYSTDDGKCGFSSREYEFLIFLAVVLVWKGRKTTGFLHYISNFYFYSKIASSILFFLNNAMYGIIYTSIVIVLSIVLPEPIVTDSGNIVYFQGEAFRRELERNKSVVWIIEFFTVWSPECRYIAPVFASLSDKYTLKNLRFGKLDVGRYQKEGEHFRINTHPLSKQLPSIAVFKGGVQVNRRPAVGTNSRVIPFTFTEENCIIELELNDLYEECKNKVNKFEKKENSKKQE